MTVTAQPLQLLHETYAFWLRTEVIPVIAGHHSTSLQLPGRLRSMAMTWANATRHTAIGMSLVGGRRISAKRQKATTATHLADILDRRSQLGLVNCLACAW